MPGKNKIIFLSLAMFLFSSCHLGYVIKAARGQFDLVCNSVPLEEALKSGKLTDDQESRIRLVAGIKSFGEDFLGLKKTRNYESVYLKSSTPIYLVSASPKDRLMLKTWWFPLVGEVPYLGFFELEEAREEMTRLLKEDFDVIISKAEAYSTLGWLRDPVTLRLIDGSVPEYVEIILHEMTHATLYVKGQGEFNEGLASFVGKFGALQYMEKTYGASHALSAEARSAICDERLFSAYLSELLEKLEKLYASSLDYHEKMILRSEIFKASRHEFECLSARFHTGRYKYFGHHKLNNAYLMTIGLYHRHFRLFESVLKQNGNSVKDMFFFLQGLEQKGGDMISKMSVALSGVSGPYQPKPRSLPFGFSPICNIP